MSLLARWWVIDDDTGSTRADCIGDGGEQGVSVDGDIWVLGDEFADFGGDGVDESDNKGHQGREKSREGGQHLFVSFVDSLAKGVGHIETEAGAFFRGDGEDVGEFIEARFHG